MSITVRQVIDRVMARLGQTPGVDVQTYSEPVLIEQIRQKVDALFDHYWWPQFYNPGEVFTLDGTTGVVNEDLTDKIKRFEDIRYVWYGEERQTLPLMPLSANPVAVKQRCFGPAHLSSKIIRVYPIDTTGEITIAYRTRPDEVSQAEDVIEFDSQLIILGTAYDFLNGSGVNPAEEQKIAQMFDTRLNQLISNTQIHGVALGAVESPSWPTTWQE